MSQTLFIFPYLLFFFASSVINHFLPHGHKFIWIYLFLFIKYILLKFNCFNFHILIFYILLQLLFVHLEVGVQFFTLTSNSPISLNERATGLYRAVTALPSIKFVFDESVSELYILFYCSIYIFLRQYHTGLITIALSIRRVNNPTFSFFRTVCTIFSLFITFISM